MNEIWRRVRFLFRRRRFDREIEEEMRFHLEMKTQAEGGTEQARFAAHRQFGNTTLWRELSHEMWGWSSLEYVFQDLRYGLRMLVRSPAFATVAILSLALGIGANTAIFSLMDAVMIRMLPVHQPEELVSFGDGTAAGISDGFPNHSWGLFSHPMYLQFRDANDVFSDVLAYRGSSSGVYLKTAGENSLPEPLLAHLVSGNYFSALGVNAVMGRTLTPKDDLVPGAHAVMVISYAYWQRRFARNPAVVGYHVTLGKTPFSIVGVAPPEFFGAKVDESPDAWIPLMMEAEVSPGSSKIDDRMWQTLCLMARLKPGVTREQAQANVNLLFRQMLTEYAGPRPSERRQRDIQHARVSLMPAARGISALRLQFSRPLMVLMAFVALVLSITCANIANLLVARGAAREKEISLRVAIGAGSVRLMRQLFTESILLGVLGGAAGMVIGIWGSSLLAAMVVGVDSSLTVRIRPDAYVLGFTGFISVLTGVIFGMAPAWRAARVDLNASLKQGRIGTRGRGKLAHPLVVAQIALSLILVFVASLFVRSLKNLQQVETGFKKENALLAYVDTGVSGYDENEHLANVYRRVEEHVKTIPGVRAASFAITTFNDGVWRTPPVRPGDTGLSDEERFASLNIVGPEFFQAMGIPLLAGRTFGGQDTDRAPRVAVINEALARWWFPNESPLGKRFGWGSPALDTYEIIGVVKNTKQNELQETTLRAFYFPYSQHPHYLESLIVRIVGDRPSLAGEVRRAITEADRNLPVVLVGTLSEKVDQSLVEQRAIARLAGFFGVLALVLASVGLYGVMSYGVARRTNEIGVRLALGAARAAVVRMVMRETMLLVLIGIGLGLPAAMVANRLVSSLLFGLSPADPVSLGMAALVMAAVAALAGYLPARKAARVDPMEALWYE